jgi:hypothetical protein
MSVQAAQQVEPSAYFFNARELARLAVYRAAVVARFYNDQCEPDHGGPSADTIRLLDSVRSEQRAAA